MLLTRSSASHLQEGLRVKSYDRNLIVFSFTVILSATYKVVT